MAKPAPLLNMLIWSSEICLDEIFLTHLSLVVSLFWAGLVLLVWFVVALSVDLDLQFLLVLSLGFVLGGFGLSVWVSDV